MKKSSFICMLQLILVLVSCVPLYSNNLYKLKINGKYGYINEIGKLLIEPTFDIAYQFKEDRAYVVIDGSKFFINELGEIVFEIEERSEYEFSQGMVAFIKGGKWGFLDRDGKVVIKPYWNRANNFSNDLALVKTDEGKYSYINKDGNLAFGEIFFDVGRDFAEEVAIVRKQIYPNTSVDILNRNGKRTISGLRGGVINKKGELITPYILQTIDLEYSSGLLSANLVNEYHPLGYVLTGFINTKGDFVIDPILTKGGRFKEGLAPASTGELYGFIDMKGDFVVPEKFEVLQSLSEGLAVFQVGDKYGYVNRLGEIVIEASFDLTVSFEKGFGFIRLGKDSGYIDHDGNIFWASDYE